MINQKIGWEKDFCFKDLKNPVKSIWIEGELERIHLGKMVAIVGSRRNTEYGKRVAEKLVFQLSNLKVPVVSGFMYGTDQTVHRACIEAGVKTIAVLGWGIRYQNIDDDDKKLWCKIVDSGGVILSEWELQPPAYWTFPARDRIMAAISKEIYVLEAAEKSGALITAEMGRELGKTIWAVPGSVFSSVSVGTNKLIAYRKAKMWLPNQQLHLNISIDKDLDIYKVLQNELLTADEIAKKVNKPIDEVLQELMMLCLEGRVVEREGKYSIIY